MANNENVLKGISQFYQSFSGTDTLAFVLFPECSPIVLGSLTTVSYSTYRNKKPVINIGRTHINGITRGSRIFAGTLVFTLVHQHWLEDVKDQIDYLKDMEDIKADELPLFDIMIVSANEYGNNVSMYIYGVDFTDEAQTISVQDLFTENVFSFVARDVSTFKAGNGIKTKSNQSAYAKVNVENGIRLLNLNESDIRTNENQERLQKYEKEQNDLKTAERLQEFTRPLYFSSSRMMIGSDVSRVQMLLKKDAPGLTVNGIFDKETENAVRLFQSNQGLTIDGIVNTRTFEALVGNKTGINVTGAIANKEGARVFRKPDMTSPIVDYVPFNSIITIEERLLSEDKIEFYKAKTGYMLARDIYDFSNKNGIQSFPQIKIGDSNVYVQILLDLLKEIYPKETVNMEAVYSFSMQNLIKKFQTENELESTGIVDAETWFALQLKIGKTIKDETQDIFVAYYNPPGEYNSTTQDLITSNRFDVKITTKTSLMVKQTAVVYFPNGKTKTLTKSHLVKDGETVSIKDLQPYLYDEQNGYPTKVEYFVIPYGSSTYKWTIDISKRKE